MTHDDFLCVRLNLITDFELELFMLNAPFTPSLYNQDGRYSLNQIEMIFLFAREKINPTAEFFMKEAHEEAIAEYFNKKILNLLDAESIHFDKLKKIMELVLSEIVERLKMKERDLNCFWAHLIKDCFKNGNILDNNPTNLCPFAVFLSGVRKQLKEVETVTKENMSPDAISGMQQCLRQFIGQLIDVRSFREARAIHNFMYLARYIATCRIKANADGAEENTYVYLAPLIGPCLLHGLRLEKKIDPNLPVGEYKFMEKFAYALLASSSFDKDFNNIDYRGVHQSVEALDFFAEYLWDYVPVYCRTLTPKQKETEDNGNEAKDVDTKESEHKKINQLSNFLSKMKIGKSKSSSKHDAKTKKGENSSLDSTPSPSLELDKENVKPLPAQSENKTTGSNDNQGPHPKPPPPHKLKKKGGDELSKSLTDLMEASKSDKTDSTEKVKLMSSSAGKIPKAEEFNLNQMEQPESPLPKAQENEKVKSFLLLHSLQSISSAVHKMPSTENNNNNNVETNDNNVGQVRKQKEGTHKKIKKAK